jgi:hypothetical protein
VKRQIDPYSAALHAVAAVCNPMTVSPSDLLTVAGLVQLGAGHVVEAGAVVAAKQATTMPAGRARPRSGGARRRRPRSAYNSCAPATGI